MYLSRLLINVGDNPDRPRPGRLWLRNIYAVHQRLCMAFPENKQKETDQQLPELSDPRRSKHYSRSETSSTAGLLFRIDPLQGNRAMILVQSENEPDWEYAFLNAGKGMLLAADPAVSKITNTPKQGEQYLFRIQVNLSKTSREHRKRVSLTWSDTDDADKVIGDWLDNKAEVFVEEERTVKAFEIKQCCVRKLGWVYGYKPVLDKAECQSQNNFKIKADKLKFRSALLDGVLKVCDSTAMAKICAAGIGSAKAFGFGLMSLKKLS